MITRSQVEELLVKAGKLGVPKHRWQQLGESLYECVICETEVEGYADSLFACKPPKLKIDSDTFQSLCQKLVEMSEALENVAACYKNCSPCRDAARAALEGWR